MVREDELIRAIGRLEGKMDQLIANQKANTDRMNRIDQDIEDVRDRVTSLEKKQYTIITIATIAWAGMLIIFRKFF